MTARRGGARPGSGPKPKPETRMVTRAFVIRQDQAKWLYQMAHSAPDHMHLEYVTSQSELVRQALDKMIEGKP